MVDVHIASNPKLSRLTVAERWCHVAGILSLAALAPIRGRLLIGDEPAEPKDVAKRAGVSVGVARSTLEKLRKVGVIVPDEEWRCERVHDFDDWNPAPKTDATNAERQARYRAKRNGVTGTVTNAAVTPTEVEEKRSNTPPTPPRGGRERERLEYGLAFNAWVAEHFPGVQPSLVEYSAGILRGRNRVPTVEELRPLIETGAVRPKEAA